ncbi:hypothetical protein GPUN_2897 [Glaciecola punicea ACAM 611]|uniref:Uncharacterized protein n=1 Tax=Glaciecola punicea ACAM 611 TaxID=1121923 RepID=H5TF84_9ALTE|nr:hypothetical protein GPUN_2897 [Glaciecola punicea ACAM 611]
MVSSILIGNYLVQQAVKFENEDFTKITKGIHDCVNSN